jgi:hypothetical protein
MVKVRSELINSKMEEIAAVINSIKYHQKNRSFEFDETLNVNERNSLNNMIIQHVPHT